MNPLATFLPLDRRIALAADRLMPDRVQGAALFADISGFTPLTAVLAQELGPHRGAEELIRQLNRVYTDLITQVHHFRGNVIGFSGDAITCWFDDTDSGDSGAVTLALACALELQQVMARLEAIQTPGGARIPLKLKVSLAAGPARRFLVGDPQHYVMEALAGSTLDQMSAAEKLAAQGEVVLTAAALEHLSAAPTITAWRKDEAGQRYAVVNGMAQIVTPPPQPPIPTIAATTSQPWLLPPVFDRLQQNSDDFLADLRPAVVLFLRFSGIDYDGDDDAGDKLDAFIRHTQAILNYYEGFLIQLTMGDKGSYLYITFGAPIAHENDAARAADAVLKLRDLPSHFPFLRPVQIGVSLGLIHSGACGSPIRRTFGVMGKEVNIAARLMTTAQPGQILVSPQMAEAIRTAYVLAELPPVQLKGVAEPMVLWDLRQRRADSPTMLAKQSGAPMVGRAAEQQQMALALAHLRDGRSTTLLIEGQAGIGKSRLAQELLSMIDHTTIQALVGSGDAVEQSTPYHAWRFIFQQLFAPEPNGLRAQRSANLQQRVTAVLDPALHDLLPLLEAVLPVDLPDTTLTAQLTGEARQENTLRLLVNLLAAAVGQNHPLLLIVEDAHWLDSASWRLLWRVQRQVQPLLLVVITRPFTEDQDTSIFYNDLSELPTTQRITLDMLPLAAINDLICQRLGVKELPTAVTDLIHAKAEGHPFFSEELAFALRDASLIQIENGTCYLAANRQNFDALNFPNTIQGVITSRIDRLSPPQQLTVKVASVIGRIFTFTLLHNIYPIAAQEEQLHQHLDQLERLGITPLETPPPNLAYIFKHLVTQEVVYNLMTYAQRQQLHQRTAAWYEQTQSGDLARFYPLLAYHWRLAGADEKAVAYYEKAGENAFRDYANQEAIRFFTQALELSGAAHSPVQHARWQRHLGEAAYRLTLMEKSQSHYLAALELLERPLPATLFRRLPGLLHELVRQVRSYRQYGRAPLPVADETAQSALLEAARAYDGVSEIYYNTGDFLTTFYCVMAAFNLAGQAGISPELVRGYANMCPTLGTVSLHKLANSYRQRALALAASLDHLPTTAYIQIPFSSYSLWVGDWARAEEEIETALAIYARLGDWRHWCVAAWLWPQVARGQSDLEREQQLWAELYQVALSSQDARHQVRSRGGQMFSFLALGRQEEAFARADAVGVLLAENPEMQPVEERLWYAIRAARALRQEQWAEARALAHELIAAIGRARFKFDLLDVFATSAEVFLTLWERSEADAREARQGCRVLNQYARTYPFARPLAQQFQARYKRLAGR
ncbi:MAG: AAA family ATPase [Chloroflexi bacterium]|nr:AAA family ATPase [Chloroflexota bacterium]